MDRRERGFTIIELIAVILILGILGAVAAPRFLNIAGSARQASFDTVRAAFEVAVYSAHAVWIAEDGAGAATLTIEGDPVEVNASGWPRIDAAAVNQTTAADLYQALMASELPADWSSSEDLVANTADFTYEGMTLHYDAMTGQVSVP